MSTGSRLSTPHSQVGRYALFDVIATGGMASVHLGRLDGAVGFSRVVAIKRLHPHLALDQDFRDMFLSEARLAARVRHPNVVQTFDVVATGDEVSLVMEYVQGESLSWLLRETVRRNAQIPLHVAASIMVNALHGLHAAHEACDERGVALEIVHRDVSPQNVMVGEDGVARVFDFGVAKALQSVHQTRAGQVKGKASYMAPEQIKAAPLDRRADVFAAGVVLWELLTGCRLFHGPTDAARIMKVMEGNYESPANHRPELPPNLTAACLRALAFSETDRFSTALDFADEIEAAVTLASQRTVSEWMKGMAAASLSTRAQLVKQVETSDVFSVSPMEVAAGSSASRPGGVASSSHTPTPRAGSASELVMTKPGWRSHPLVFVATGVVASLAVVAIWLGARASTTPASAPEGPRPELAVAAARPVAIAPIAPVNRLPEAEKKTPGDVAPGPTAPHVFDADAEPVAAANAPAVKEPAKRSALPKKPAPKAAGKPKGFRPTEL